MAQVFKFFCFAISVFLFLQLADAGDSEETPKDGAEPKTEDGEEHTATFLKNISKVKNSAPGRMVRQVTGIAGNGLKTFTKEFESNLNAESKNHLNGENSFIPNFVENNVILPGKVAAQTSFDILSKPVGEIVSNIKDTYKGELAKSEKEENYVPIIGHYTKIANKPVALLKASRDIVGSTFGNMFGRAKSFWSSRKNDQANKPEKQDN